MRSVFSQDSDGTTRLRPWAPPLIVAGIGVLVIGGMLLGIATSAGSGAGLAAGALAVAGLIVAAARAKPGGAIEVADRPDAGRRVLVVATTEVGPDAAQQIADGADGADDVRLLVPMRTRRLDRWLSADDPARRDAERQLAHSAGALVAAGLPVSGSLGDSDPAQALEDELRSYPADEVMLLSGSDGEDALADVESRLAVPVRHISA